VSLSSLPDSSDSEASSCCDILDSCTADRGVAVRATRGLALRNLATNPH
jgi:hypothetical protein